MSPDYRTGDVRVVRPIRSSVARHGRPDTLTSTGLLRPFAGVLGPWRPPVEGNSLRLSFLALPRLVREYTTERVTREERTVERTPPEDTTPETTTVYRLLRIDEGEGRDVPAAPGGEHGDTGGSDVDVAAAESTRIAERLGEVLRWRPVLVGGPAASDRIGDRPAETGTTPGSEPSTVRRTFRAVPTGSASDRSGARGGDGERTGPDGRAGRRTPTAERTRTAAAVRTPIGGRRSRTRSAGVDAPADRRWSPGTTRPALLTERSPMMLRRPWDPTRYGTDAADVRESTAGSRVVDRYGSAEPDQTFDGSPDPLPGRDERSGAVDFPTRDRGSTGPARIAYRRADVGTGGAIRAAGTSSALTALSASATGGSTQTPARPLAALGASEATERSGPTAEAATERREAPAPTGAPTPPFASFPSTEAAVDHVYREIERRWRIERERRGL